MMHKLLHGLGFVVVALLALGSGPAVAAAVGPYYATPSWDQTLSASTRFIVLSNFNNAAVLDRETGLVWEQSPDTTPTDWYSASEACFNKNVGGRGGWKLPSIQELRSLIDPALSNPALPVGHPFTVQPLFLSFYWSATVYREPSSQTAWAMRLYSGVAQFSPKTSTGDPNISLSLLVWCVRGGPGVDVQ
jgi:hypothetical protein